MTLQSLLGWLGHWTQWFNIAAIVSVKNQCTVGVIRKLPINPKTECSEKGSVFFVVVFFSILNHGEAEDSDGLDSVAAVICFGCECLDWWNPWKSCLWCLWGFFSRTWRPCSRRFFSFSLFSIGVFSLIFGAFFVEFLKWSFHFLLKGVCFFVVVHEPCHSSPIVQLGWKLDLCVCWYLWCVVSG